MEANNDEQHQYQQQQQQHKSMINKKSLLEYLPFSTLIDSSFWFEIKRIKLDVLKLSIEPIDIYPSYSIRSNISGLVTLNYEAFESYDKLCDQRIQRLQQQQQQLQQQQQNFDDYQYYLNGKIIIFNTVEEFDMIDKTMLIKQQGKLIWDALNDVKNREQIDSNLEYHLSKFFMIVYGNFKTYDFKFWNSYPSLSFPPNCFKILKHHNYNWNNYFNFKQTESLLEQFKCLPVNDRLFFAIILRNKNEDNDVEIVTFKNLWTLNFIEKLYHEHRNNNNDNIKVIFTFNDYSHYFNHPGWLLRNYLAYIHVRLAQLYKQHVNNEIIHWWIRQCLYNENLLILSLKLPKNNQTIEKYFNNDLSNRSFILNIAILPWDFKKLNPNDYLQGFFDDVKKFYNDSDGQNKFIPSAVGWERNKRFNNRLVPNEVNCGNTLNPEIIATDALYLNLKLMKWRLVQNLDLELIKNTRCLLLGSGTLGCYVSRSLVAWGINNITMVDNKNVSYSNPARQSLYTYQDAIGGQQSKAQTSAQALKKINPSINSKGVDINIKMPGHFFEKSIEEEMKEIEILEKLIDETDVVFLLTDTRESRWLPTLIATSKHKIIINVALGFDSYLVQRFGIRLNNDDECDKQSKWWNLYQKQIEIYNNLFPNNNVDKNHNGDHSDLMTRKSTLLLGTELGCYFCNDVMAPTNSTKDRTLDQQCTVTRPGLSLIASGIAVELLMSILQHPAGPLAPAVVNTTANDYNQGIQSDRKNSLNIDNNGNNDDLNLLKNESLLGSIPHECRGFLSIFEQIKPTTKRSEYCVACSFKIISKYRNDKQKFLYESINNSKTLELLTGLDKFHNINEMSITLADIVDNDENEIDDENDKKDDNFIMIEL